MDIIEPTPSNQYGIYALVDPTDETVHYVGQTRNPQRRLEQHMAERHHQGNKGDWLRGLIQKGQQPYMQILETVTDEKAALKKEQEWIRHFVEKKMPLLNAQVQPRQCRPLRPSIPPAEIYHVSWEHLFDDIFSHSKQKNSARSPKASLTIKAKIKENLSLIAEKVEELKTLEAHYKELDAQATDLSEQWLEYIYRYARLIRHRHGSSTSETLAAAADHFQVKNVYSLPESAWPAVLDWFASLLEEW